MLALSELVVALSLMWIHFVDAQTNCTALYEIGDYLPREECENIKANSLCSVYTPANKCVVTCNDCVAPTAAPTAAPVDCVTMANSFPDILSSDTCKAAPNFDVLCRDPAFNAVCQFSCSGCSTGAPTLSPSTLVPTAQPTLVPTQFPSTSTTQAPMSSAPTGSPTDLCIPRELCSEHPRLRQPILDDPALWDCGINYPGTGNDPVLCFTTFGNETDCDVLNGLLICEPSLSPTNTPTSTPTASPSTNMPTSYPSPQECSVNTLGDSQCASLIADANLIGIVACHNDEIKDICGKACCETRAPTLSPSTSHPTNFPSVSPTGSPSTSPSSSPTYSPTERPSRSQPTQAPSTTTPTVLPTTSYPSHLPTTLPTESPTAETCDANLDLMFLIDESSSVSNTDWQRALEYVKQIAQRFKVGRSLECGLGGTFSDTCTYTGDWLTRVSIATFSGAANRGPDDDGMNPNAIVHVSFDNFTNIAELLDAIDQIPHAGGATYTDAGLSLVNSEVIPQARPIASGIARVLIVVTDGMSTPGHDPAAASELLRNNGLTSIFTVVVGTFVDSLITDISQSVSGSLSQTYTYDTFSELIELESLLDITDATCIHAQCGPDLVGNCLNLVGDQWSAGELPGCSDPSVRAQCPSTCCRHNYTAPTAAPTLTPSSHPASSYPTEFPTTADCSEDAAGTAACQQTFAHYWDYLGSDPCEEPELRIRCQKSCCEHPQPTVSPTHSPTTLPSLFPTESAPTHIPSIFPTYSLPTASPTAFPTRTQPTTSPTMPPTTSLPTEIPTVSPTMSPTIQTCDEDLDLVFLLDESSSMGVSTNWTHVLQFVKDIAAQFKVGREYVCGTTPGSACAFIGAWKTRVGVATFSSPNLRPDGVIRSAHPHIHLDDSVNFADFSTAVDSIVPQPGSTFTDDGVELIQSSFVPDMRNDSTGVARVLVVVTDSLFSPGHDPTGIAASIRNDNRTTIIGVAVGGSVPHEIANMVQASLTGELDHTFYASDATKLPTSVLEPVHGTACDHALCGLDSIDNCESITGDDRIGCYDEDVYSNCSATCCIFQFRSTSTLSPTTSPTSSPTKSPTTSPTSSPTMLPTRYPTSAPSLLPTTEDCASDVAGEEACRATLDHFLVNFGANACDNQEVKDLCKRTCCLIQPPSAAPSIYPTSIPSQVPTSQHPTQSPSNRPTSGSPTATPTHFPTFSAPTAGPTGSTTQSPTLVPSVSPTASPTVARCDQDLDLMFLLDESSSVSLDTNTISDTWFQMLEVVRNVTKRFTVGRELVCGVAPGSACAFLGRWRTRVGIATYSSPNLRPDGSIQSSYSHVLLGEHDNPADLSEAIDSIVPKPGSTFTDLGLKHVQDTLIPDIRAKSEGIARVLIVLTDTKHTENHDPTDISRSIIAHNDTIILGVALGNGTNDLNSLAAEMAQKISVSEPPATPLDRTYATNNGEDLGHISDALVAQSCDRARCGIDEILYCSSLVDIFSINHDPFSGCGHHLGNGVLLADRCGETCCDRFRRTITTLPPNVVHFTVNPPPTPGRSTPPPAMSTTLPSSTTTTTEEPVLLLGGKLSESCDHKVDTFVGVCDARLCCEEDPVVADLVSTNCEATCCSVSCPSGQTDAPTPTPVVNCEGILCADQCIGQCGWSSNKNMCKPGGKTTERELGNGICPSQSSQLSASERCEQIQCGAQCNGECGWSSKRNMCKLGGTTKNSELNSGICTSTETPNIRCSQYLCGADCTGVCGWSSKHNVCKFGGRTTGVEMTMGQCSSTMITRPILPEEQCKAVTCAADCIGMCGWSSRRMKCRLGGTTTDDERSLGQC